MKDIEDEIPFEVPEGWAWCRLGEICKFIGGGTPDKGNAEYWNGNIPWASVKDIKDSYLYKTVDCITEKGLAESAANIADIDDLILVTRISPGKAIQTKIRTSINQDLKIVKASKYINKEYLLRFFDWNEKNFLSVSSGTTVKGIKIEDVVSTFIPIPAVEEQGFIIENLKDIYTQIDSLENSKIELQIAIKHAKSKILDLAIHGKLVPQDPSEEPASKLLEKIRAEKEAKIAAGELKRDKNDSYIYKNPSDNCHYRKYVKGYEVNIEAEIDFTIPQTWTWCSLKEVCHEFIVPQRDKPKLFGGTIPWCRIEDIQGKYLDGSLSNQNVTENTIREMNMHKCPVNSLIVACSASIGNQAIVKKECCTNQTFIGIVNNQNVIDTEYLYYYFRSLKKKLTEMGTGTTIKYISREKFESLVFPLPPLAEQKRIISNIEIVFECLDNISKNI